MNIALGSVREGIPFFTIQFFKRDFNGQYGLTVSCDL